MINFKCKFCNEDLVLVAGGIDNISGFSCTCKSYYLQTKKDSLNYIQLYVDNVVITCSIFKKAKLFIYNEGTIIHTYDIEYSLEEILNLNLEQLIKLSNRAKATSILR